jgi:hypothetical protein
MIPVSVLSWWYAQSGLELGCRTTNSSGDEKTKQGQEIAGHKITQGFCSIEFT